MKGKGHRITQANFKKNKVRGLNLTDFKTYKAMVIKTAQNQERKGHIDQWSKRVGKYIHTYNNRRLSRKLPKQFNREKKVFKTTEYYIGKKLT